MNYIVDQDWPALPLCAEHSQADARVDVANSENPALDDHPAASAREEMDYDEFLAKKIVGVVPAGFVVDPAEINPALFLFQRDIVRWALRLGRAALFEECGLGKTLQELEWSRHVVKHTGGKVLILTPLAVAHQTIREGEKFGISVRYCLEQSEVTDSVHIAVTNYERLHLFDLEQFVGVVLDESSILKSYTGKTKQDLINRCASIPYKLCATATPAPNDHLELGNHAEFLGIMPSNEMIMRWFINDTMAAGKYRLKKHAERDFWRWLTSWAVCLSKPGDLGSEYDMPEFELPELNIVEHWLKANAQTIERAQSEGRLLPDTNPSSTTMHKVKRESLDDRVTKAAELAQGIDGPTIIWCDTNYEADALMKVVPEASEVRGDQTINIKEHRLNRFSQGHDRQIITKAEIAGFGLNWQHCADQIFVGVTFSFEKTYQALRRSYRFGQKKAVNAHFIYSEGEGNILSILKQKQAAFAEMQSAMNAAMREYGLFRDENKIDFSEGQPTIKQGETWTLYLGDCVTVARQLPDNSIDFGIHSPPFANLYLYTDSIADMGNSADHEEFFQHYRYLISELYRTTRPGRLCAVHCKDLPSYINHDDAAGLIDFPGRIIRAFEDCGWQYHSRVTIWKDPVIEQQRTNNHGLLHRNFANSTEACRQGMPDYLIVFRKWPIDGGLNVTQQRKPGDYIGTEPPGVMSYTNSRRQTTPPWWNGTIEEYNYSIAVWQKYASPVWFDIRQATVLNYEMAKDSSDERHICPLQLDVIDRAIDLWTNPGEVVFSPFAGIGSEGTQSILAGRRFIGIELKPSYFNQAVKFLTKAEIESSRVTLWQHAGVAL